MSWADVQSIAQASAIVAGGLSACIAALAAANNWFEKARETARGARKRRQSEVTRLLGELRSHKKAFDEFFDYATEKDAHLRIDNLIFTNDEAATRATVDAAFEHLRDVHRSVKLSLIKPDDLGPWVYWVHRIFRGREPLRLYARACGYNSFLTELHAWTSKSPELVELNTHCTWFPKESSAAGGT